MVLFILIDKKLKKKHFYFKYNLHFSNNYLTILYTSSVVELETVNSCVVSSNLIFQSVIVIQILFNTS